MGLLFILKRNIRCSHAEFSLVSILWFSLSQVLCPFTDFWFSGIDVWLLSWWWIFIIFEILNSTCRFSRYWIVGIPWLIVILELNIWLDYLIILLLSYCFELHDLRFNSYFLKLLLQLLQTRGVLNNNLFLFFFRCKKLFKVFDHWIIIQSKQHSILLLRYSIKRFIK